MITYPLSLYQKRLAFLGFMDKESPVYNVPRVYEFKGNVSFSNLERSFVEIINRHEILRSRFKIENVPVQYISEEQSFRLPVIDVRKEAMDDILSLITKEAKKNFYFHEQLFYAKLYQIQENHFYLLINAHHLVIDGWSLDLLLEELKILYNHFVSEEPLLLPEIDIGYIDFCVWQEENLTDEYFEEAIKYWYHNLEGIPELLKFCYDYPRPRQQENHGEKVFFDIPTNVFSTLSTWEKQHAVTIFTSLLASWQLLLHIYSNENKVAIGCPAAIRNLPELENLIGMFVNTVIYCSDFSTNVSFWEIVTKLKKQLLEGYEYKDIPLDKLIAKINPKRDRSYNPLFQSMFNYHNMTKTKLDFNGCQVKEVVIDNKTSKFDISLEVFPEYDYFRCFIEYNNRLFKKETIQKLIQRYLFILEQVCRNPNINMESIKLILPEEEKTLRDWNNTSVNFPKQSLFLQIWQTAQKHSDKTAIIFNDTQWSYGDLQNQVGLFAEALRKAEVKTDDFVAIYLERGAEIIASILAIWKLGAAYVPLDPAHPSQRNEFVINDAKITAAITSSSLATNFLHDKVDNLICIDDIKKNEENFSILQNEVFSEENNAYLIYTSGSTGKPKGVLVKQKSIHNFLQAINRDIHITHSDKWLSLATFTFDISLIEFLLPLLHGATVVLASQENILNPNWIQNIINEQNISILQATPPTWNLLLQNNWNGSKIIAINAGDALPVKTSNELVGKVDKLLNFYGPTEATVYVTTYQVEPNKDYISIPIGKPINNTRTYVLNRYLSDVPIGVIGDLFLGGVCLAEGYWQRPDLSNEKFINRPVYGRLYKTGDLIRYLNDGNIEFYGRTDFQIKIRGFRIECGEIEVALESFEPVSKAIVIAKEISQAKELVAYVQINVEVSIAQIRQYLQQKVPDYMIPTVFIFVDNFILTSSGKIDRNRLPEPIQTNSQKTKNNPRNFQETIIYNAFVSILKKEDIGIHDNFFDLGGHSLQIYPLFQKIEQQMGLSLPVATIFENSTIASLAYAFEMRNIKQKIVTCIRKEGKYPPLICIHSVEGNALNYYSLAQKLGNDYPVYVIDAPRNNDGDFIMFNSLEERASYYIKELDKFFQQDNYLLAGHSAGGFIAYEMARQLKTQNKYVPLLCFFDTKTPYKDKNYWFQLTNHQHFFKHFPAWLSKLWNDRQRNQRIKKMLGFKVAINQKEQNWLSILPQKTKDFVNSNQKLHQRYFAQHHPYDGNMYLFRIHRKNNHPINNITEDYNWQKYSGGSVQVVYGEGEHHSILYAKYVDILIPELQKAIKLASKGCCNE